MSMKYLTSIFLLCLFALPTNDARSQTQSSWASNDKASFTPQIHHPNIKSVTLFAQNPDLVTPVGVAVSPDGRVFVQENHTHKRESNYSGPKTDRILVFEDTNGDGVADKRSVFYEGHTFSTDLLFGPDGHLYVSTRWFIGRFLNASSKQSADGEPEKLVVCETEGDYPHNGIGGLAIDPADPDSLAFGFGENLGVDYTFVGSDGTKLSGGGEGGSTYRCRTDGAELTRLSTGHWNAFGMTYDLAGNLFSTDNDPDATPPNRLLHVIPGADFGYEFRYGRSGRHPLVCWNGENPGTLGMAGVLNEAACGVIPFGVNHLLTASWTDNRVDLHKLTPKGASLEATREQFLSGPDDFRPVHFSYSTDGRFLYISDWVKISYPVHGHGRIWRVEFKQPVSLTPLPRTNEIAEPTIDKAIELLGSPDPYVRTAAMNTLVQHPKEIEDLDWKTMNEVARVHYAVTLKRIDQRKGSSGQFVDRIPDLLLDKSSDVRFVAIKWIADETLEHHRVSLEQLLKRDRLSRRDLKAVVASLAKISSPTTREFSPDDTLLKLTLDDSNPIQLRRIALQSLNVDHPRLTIGVLESLLDLNDAIIQREAVHILAIHPDANKASALNKVAGDESLDANLRADAIAGLASLATENADVLQELANHHHPIIANEARRTLVSAGLLKRKLPAKPSVDQLSDWNTLIDEVEGEPDPNVGRRLFFHNNLAGCYKCHAVNGRGNEVGPDLTTIHKQSGITQTWLLKHIVHPSAEMAPYYRPQQLLTFDGQVLTGLIIAREGQREGYIGSDGKVFYVDKNDVEGRQELTNSIMPTGLLDPLTATEIRDLLAYLLLHEE
ncbi:membrane-bound dehydrogenase domain protein [Rhodopirellula baltica SWK14]|uniref:Membrane-bound dehydrogenase domain protein n=2 Tax=Rhodopirellula baltica TaxID=265606 RepID=L7C6E4_RHOBT|nr:membrane-bound dehydrogenase domain protein [Rhodopirellula baltica SWK14]